MAELIDDVTYLSKEIGARPAGTEEEQQAALFVAETLQQDAGFQAVIEDFNGIVNPDLPKAICFAVVFVCGLISILVPLLTLPAALISLIFAVLFILEVVDKPILSRFLKGGISQNVVAKYQPAGVPKKRRKIILVANYDSGRVVPDQKGFMQANRRIFEIAFIVGIVLIPVLLLLQSIIFPGASGVVDGVFNFLTVVAMIVVAVPVVLTIIHKKANYTDAANNNASGTAVLLDVARKVGNGCISLEEMERLAEEAGSELEGEEAAREAGLIPEGAELDYVATPNKKESAQDSLAAAHAAIAALTGKPVVASSAYAAVEHPHDSLNPEEIFAQDESDSIQSADASIFEEENAPAPAEASAYNTNYQSFTTRPSENSQESGEEKAENSEAQKPAPVATPIITSNRSADGIPSWARTAQAKARENKPEQSAPNYAVRSRYADTPAAHIQDGIQHAVNLGAAATVISAAAEASAVGTTAAVAAGIVGEASNSVDAVVETEVKSSPADKVERVVAETQPEKLSSDPALAARLAALRTEINAAPAPHISDEVRQTFADMENQAQQKAQKQSETLVSRETSSNSTDENEVASPANQDEVDSEVNATAKETTEAFNQTAVKDALNELSAKKTHQADSEEEPVDVEPEEAQYDNSETDETQDTYTEETPSSSRTARSLRRHTSDLSSSFGGFMGKVQHMAESAAAAATEAGSHLGEMTANVRNSVSADDKNQNEVTPVDQNNFNDDLQNEVSGTPEDIEVVGTEANSEEDNTLAAEAEANTEEALEPKVLDAMDVSAFMDKSVAEESSRNDASDETTKPVSMLEIREAMASVADAVVPSKEESFEAEQPIQPSDKAAKPASEQVEKQVSPIVGINLNSLPKVDQVKGFDQVIKLPELDASEVSHTEPSSQRAPMATDEHRSPLTSGAIPRISMGEIERDSQSDRFGLDLPPLGAESEVSHDLVSATSSFSTVGGTGAFAPVGDELVEGIPEEHLYVEDADDSSFEESHTETGAYAGPEYVDMPQSRVGRLFGRFGRKNKKAEQESLNEWIGADEGYTAKGAGESRESWESFREDTNSGKYEGGSFSLDNLRNIDVKSLGKRFSKNDEVAAAPADDTYTNDETKGFSVTDVEDAAERIHLDETSYTKVSAEDSAAEISEAMQHINEFRHPGIDTEVWFVALGSEIGSNSGMRAFLDAHKDELDGAVIVNLQALGAGKMSLIDTEGTLLPVKPSSRVKRFMRQAAERSKVSYGIAQLLSVETPASFAIRRGYQAFSIVGVKDGKPAYYAENDDVLENIDPKTLKDASSFVLELLKVI